MAGSSLIDNLLLENFRFVFALWSGAEYRGLKRTHWLQRTSIAKQSLLDHHIINHDRYNAARARQGLWGFTESKQGTVVCLALFSDLAVREGEKPSRDRRRTLQICLEIRRSSDRNMFPLRMIAVFVHRLACVSQAEVSASNNNRCTVFSAIIYSKHRPRPFPRKPRD